MKLGTQSRAARCFIHEAQEQFTNKTSFPLLMNFLFDFRSLAL
jgi:hypothetical protein